MLHNAIAELPPVDVSNSVVQAPSLPPRLASRLDHLEALVVPGHRVVYLLRHHSLRRSATGARFFVFVLAGVVACDRAPSRWGRKKAYAEEPALWTRFFRDERVDPGLGLRYRADLLSARKVMEEAR